MKLLDTVHALCGQTREDERAGVANPRRLAWLALLDFAAWVGMGVISWLAVYFTPHHSALHATVVTGLVFPPATYLLLRRRRRARAYQRGWLDGRKLMMASIEEAVRRDMTLSEWVRSEVERDEKVIQHL